ncbi:MAG: ABC transporter permease, partial [Alphaproteobacteria bacterium]|nr:ABC transporter permease [Alphaproteobacteria bacterium]
METLQNKTNKTNSTWSLLKPLVKTYLSPYAGQLAVAVLFMMIAAAATAAFAKLLQPVLDQAMIGVQNDPQTIHVIVPLGAMIFASFVTRGIATYIHTIKMNKISQSIVADIQRDVFAHFMTLDLKFFHKYPSGQLVSRVTNDVNVMRTAVSDSLTGIGSNLLTLIFLIGVMVLQDWRLSLITFTIFPLASGLVAYLGRRLRKVSKSIQGETANLMGVLTQIFQGIRQVQAYGMENSEKDRAGSAVMTVRNLNIKAARISNLSTPINEMLVGAVVFGIIVYGGYRISEGQLTPGGLMSFIAAFSLAYEP